MRPRRIDVEIPAGVDTGNTLRLAGEGEQGDGGAGNLYLEVHVKPHAVFKRKGNDIHADVPLPFTLAALGGEIEVPTLKGTAMLKIPSGTQSNTIFNMKGKGLPSIEGHGTGSQKVRVVVEVPKRLTKKQHELLEQFGKASEESERGAFKIF